MVYLGYINEKSINKCQLTKLSREKVHEKVDIEETLLKEKDSWYIGDDNKVYFFKKRQDGRIFGEIISEHVMKSLEEDTAHYSIASVNNQLGLLTPNFQNLEEHNYYDLRTLCQILPYLPKNYNETTLKQILEAFEYSGLENYQQIQQSIINRYVIDWGTHQVDDNPRNIIFKRNKETGLLTLAPSIDREQSFGASKTSLHFDSDKLKIWVPSIVYNDATFRQEPYLYEEMDANILELAMDYPKMTEKAFDHFFGINYNKVFNTLCKTTCQISLPDKTTDYLNGIIHTKNTEKKKILNFVKR